MFAHAEHVSSILMWDGSDVQKWLLFHNMGQ